MTLEEYNKERLRIDQEIISLKLEHRKLKRCVIIENAKFERFEKVRVVHDKGTNLAYIDKIDLFITGTSTPRIDYALKQCKKDGTMSSRNYYLRSSALIEKL